jgi:hypothetical protein
MLPATQAFSLLYYKSKVKSIAEEAWEHEKVLLAARGDPVPKGMTIAFRKKITRQVLQQESQEVKDEVEEYRKNCADKATEDGGEALDEGDDEAYAAKAKQVHK